jgi:ATP-binding cassette, subfamily B, bacterial
MIYFIIITLTILSMIKKSPKEIINNARDIFNLVIRVNKFAFKYTPKYQSLLLFTMVILVSIPFIISWLNKVLIDTLVSSYETGQTSSTFIYIFLGYLTAGILYQVFRTINTYYYQLFFIDITKFIFIEMLNKLSTIDIQIHENAKYNNLMQKVKENYQYRFPEFHTNVHRVFQFSIQFIINFAIILSFSVILAPILIITVIPEFINRFTLGRRKWAIWNEDSEERRDFWDSASYIEIDKNIPELKIFGTKGFLIKRITSVLENFNNKQIEVERKRIKIRNIIAIFEGMIFGIAAFITASAVIAGRITIGSFTFYITAITNFKDATSNLLREFSSMYENGLYVKDIFEVLDFNNVIKNGTKKINSNKPPLIEFRNVWFKYPNTKNFIFKDLSFTLEPGEHLAIVGKNGAGKSTFIKLLLRFYDIDKGEILLDGIDIKKYDLTSFYKLIAMLSQDFVRYHFTAKENIAIGDIKQINNTAEIIESSKLSGAHEFIKEYDKKYDKKLDKSYQDGTNPSVGQWQKVALARAFFKNSPILILDEPTSAIDPKSEFQIFQKLFKFSKRKSLIIVSHRFSTVRNASKIIVLEKGKIVEHGTHEELLNNDGIYKEAFYLQKRGYE